MSKYPKEVKEIYIEYHGDWSVGIGNIFSTINGDGDFLFDLTGFDTDEEISEYLEEIRKKIRELYDLMWGDPVEILFDFEFMERERLYCSCKED